MFPCIICYNYFERSSWILELLKHKQLVKREDDESGSIGNSSPNHPFVGLERNLVRIIGNMSYKNKKMQDRVGFYKH